MEAIICNAGNGTRLGAYNIYGNKCLIKNPYNKKSILNYQLDALYNINVENVFIVVSVDNLLIPKEVDFLKNNYSNMKIKCVTGKTDELMDSIKTGFENTSHDMILKLYGDVCVMNKVDLKGLEYKKNSCICMYEMVNEKKSTDTPVIYDNGKIEYWTEGCDKKYVWSCIELWKRDDLEYIIKNCGDNKRLMMTNINNFIDNNSYLEKIIINPVCEVDTKADMINLMNMWYNLENSENRI